MKENLIIPIFPLNGAIFFPETNLPLNIFEERYLDMVDYALSNSKTIGMVQSKNDGDLYSIGCLGKITSYSETEDGRYIINLSGKSYFRIIDEKKTKQKFRIIEASIYEKNKVGDLEFIENVFNKKKLLDKYQSFMGLNDSTIDMEFVKKIQSTSLIKFIAMTAPFTVVDKQMLLETFDLNELSKKLITLFDFYSRENNSDKEVN